MTFARGIPETKLRKKSGLVLSRFLVTTNGLIVAPPDRPPMPRGGAAVALHVKESMLMPPEFGPAIGPPCCAPAKIGPDIAMDSTAP